MPQVNPNILVWARKTARLTLEQATHKLSIADTQSATAVEKLEAYESGEKSPSRAMLARMAKQYRRPLLTFYLSDPPRKGDRGEDFRTLPDSFEVTENALVDALIRDIRARQSMLRSVLIDEDEATPITFTGISKVGDGVLQIANTIKKTIDFDLSKFRNQPTQEKSFSFLRSLVEDKGIFTLLIGNLGSHHTNIDTRLFRGYVLSDDIAPFIIINDQDSKSAWSFTMLHELVHIFLGQTGVSGGYSEMRIEKFCNDVASEMLLPDDEVSMFSVNSFNFDILEKQISQYARTRKISSSLVAYRLYRKALIKKNTWIALKDFYYEQWRKQQSKRRSKDRLKGSGPSYYVVRRHKLGNALVGIVQQMTSSGALTATKASTVLGVRPLKLHKLFDSGNTSKAA